MNERLALGTVQFGLEYGVANHSGRVGLQEAGRILAAARAEGINTLDTAIAYGDSEQSLGQVGVGQWNIVSKLPAFPEDVTNLHEWVKDQIHGSLARLGVSQLDAVLLHRPDQLFGRQGPELLEALKETKSSGLSKKVGVSVYAPQELDRLFETMHFDLVQAPMNIMDRRFTESGWASKLRRMGVELHVRSAFLQGLLLMPPRARPAKFSRWPSVWKEWDRWLEAEGVSALDACLRYVLSVPEVDKVVFGVDSVDQLRQILGAASGGLSSLPLWPQAIDLKLINPALWSQL